MDELNGTMGKIVDDFPVPFSESDYVKAAFPRIAEVFSVQVTVGMKALDRFSRMQWLRLCGERLQVVHAKEYINALCTPEESHTIDYPPHLDSVLRDPQTLKNLERQSKAVLDIQDGYKIKISGSCTGYVMAMSAVEDIIAKALRNTEDNEADIVNVSPVQETSSKLLNQELRRIVSQDETIVIDDEDFENFASMPNPVKRAMIGCIMDENPSAFDRHKEKVPIERATFQDINLITGIEGNAEPLFYIEDVDAAGPSHTSQMSRPRRPEDIFADGPSRSAKNNNGQSSVLEMTRKPQEDTLKYPTPVRANDVSSAPYIDQLRYGPIMQSTDKHMLSTYGAIRQCSSPSATARALKSQPSEVQKEPVSTSSYTAASLSSGASELTLASVPLPQVEDLSPPTFLTNVNPFRKKSPIKEQKDDASEEELRKLAQEKNYSPDVIAEALQQYPPGLPINKEHFMNTLERVHMIGQLVTRNVEQTHQDADSSVILVDTEPDSKSQKNTLSDKDTTAKGNTSQTKTKPIMDEEFEILDVSPMDLDSDTETSGVSGMKYKSEENGSSTETVARKRRRKKKSKNTGPLGSPQQPQKKQAAARLLQMNKEEQSKSDKTVPEQERASQQSLGNQPSKLAGQPESKSTNSQSSINKTIQDYLKTMENDVNPTDLTWEQRFKLMEERLEILQTAMNQKEEMQDTGTPVQMTDKPEKKAADFSLPAAYNKDSRDEMVTSSSDKVSKLPEDDRPFTQVGAAGGVRPTGAPSVSVSNQFSALNDIGGASMYSLPYVMNRDSRVPNQKKNPVPDSQHNVHPKVVKPKRPLRQIVIDGSNVAMMHGNSQYFSCRGLQLAVDYFVKRGHKEITVFVPMWRRNFPGPANQIRDQHILEELQKKQFLTFTPSRKIPGGRSISSYDDRYVMRLAAETDGIVVSNDNFRDLWREKVEWREVIEKRLLMFSFVGDRFMPPDDPLGRDGPSLDDFLQMPEGGVTNYSALGMYRPVNGSREVDASQQPVAAAAQRPHEPAPLMQTTFPVGWNPPKMNSRPVNRVSPAPHQKHKNTASKAKQNTTQPHDYDQEELRRQLKEVFVDQQSRVDRVLQRHPDERDLNRLSAYILEPS